MIYRRYKDIKYNNEFKSNEILDELNSKLQEYNVHFELIYIMVNASPQNIKKRLIERKRNEDKDKLNNWDTYIESKLSAHIASNVKIFINDDVNITLNDIIQYLDTV